MKKITFLTKSEFARTLNSRVDAFFKNKNEKGNWILYSKSIILITFFAASYLGALCFSFPLVLRVISAVILGLSIVGIGFNIMHDGAHDSYSRIKLLNTLAGHSMNLIGATVVLWKPKHNILHHTYTNIADHDDDIELYPLVRTLPHQKKLWFHRIQHWYFWLLYPFHLFLWIYWSDFQQYFTKRIGSKKIKFSVKEHHIFWVTKIVHWGLFLVLPVFLIGFWSTVVSYTVAMMVASIILTFVFQCAHLVEGTTIRDVGEAYNDDWVLHQLETTADFAPKSKILNWYLGGLNFQIEHHLFHDISHVHYVKVSQIVKETCKEYKVKYNEYRTFFAAIKSHFSYMKKMAKIS